MANECVPLFRPGSDVTCLTTAAVTGKTLVDISAARDVTTGLFKVATATAAARALGVATYDAASGARVPVILAGSGHIVPITARGAITAGAEVEVGSTGGVVTLASGKAIGKALDTGSNGVDVFVKLY